MKFSETTSVYIYEESLLILSYVYVYHVWFLEESSSAQGAKVPLIKFTTCFPLQRQVLRNLSSAQGAKVPLT